jgi:hypothetical protein
VFVTDSFRPTLWRITAAQVAVGVGTPEGIPVDPEIKYAFAPYAFNPSPFRPGASRAVPWAAQGLPSQRWYASGAGSLPNSPQFIGTCAASWEGYVARYRKSEAGGNNGGFVAIKSREKRKRPSLREARLTDKVDYFRITPRLT